MKKVLVIGATGAQGGSVAAHLLSRGNFAVRAFTRNPESAAAQSLRARGAEVVRGDLAERASIRAALRGVDYVFGVTKDPEHGRNLVNAVAGSEAEYFVLSTLPEIERYTRHLGIPSTFVRAAEDVGSVVAAIFECPDEQWIDESKDRLSAV
jgi:saccharopine dehydrogenase-like NADP-dependent oxidoreductase